jgi:hypothetical protein
MKVEIGNKTYYLLENDEMVLRFITRRVLYDWWPHAVNAIAYWATRTSRRVFSAPHYFVLENPYAMFENTVVRVSEDGRKATFMRPNGTEEVEYNPPITGIEDFIVRYLSPSSPREAGRQIELLDSDAQFVPMIVYAPVEDSYRLLTFVAAVHGDYISYVADDPHEYWVYRDDKLIHNGVTDRFTAPPYPSLWKRPHVVNFDGRMRIYLYGNEDNMYRIDWYGKMETYEDVVRFAFTAVSLIVSLLK